MDINATVLAAFQVEHKEQLEGIRAFLADTGSGSPQDRSRLDEAYRLAHSLKGAARVCDLRPIETVGHALETLFEHVRQGQLTLDSSVMSAVELSLNSIEDWMGALEAERPTSDLSTALSALAPFVRQGNPLASSQRPLSPLRVETELSETAPVSPAPVEPQRPAVAVSPTVDTVRVQADNLDRLLREATQLASDDMRLVQIGHELRGLGQRLEQMEREQISFRRHLQRGERGPSPTVDLGRLTRFVDTVDRQLHSLSREARRIRVQHERAAWSLRTRHEQIGRQVKAVRMVPADSILQGFRKLVRDLARDQSKQVEFTVSGQDVLVDRMVLQVLKDPLMHMLRNAVTHGIERPDERQAAGKPEMGQIKLSLEMQGHHLQIVVDDDGRGIDVKRVTELATRRGLLSKQDAHHASPEEVAALIFQPGFSTALQVTEVAGRGMGLSVVDEAINRLQGEADVIPKSGPGARFSLWTPLSVATHRLLLMRCRGQKFCIPLANIDRLLRIRPGELTVLEQRLVVRLKGQSIPVTKLSTALGMTGEVALNNINTLSIVVVRAGQRRVALAVDELLAERNLLVSPLDGLAAETSKFSGGVIVEDGSVALVIQPSELFRDVSPDRSSASALLASRAKPVQRTLLVVDDSFTTRTLEKSILEAHGFRVLVAVDGVEALAVLRAHKVDAIISDVEMPRLDGFGLLEELKKDAHLANVPVVLVTSRGRAEDQARGRALGADAYIVKRKFDHEDLLRTVGQLI